MKSTAENWVKCGKGLVTAARLTGASRAPKLPEKMQKPKTIVAFLNKFKTVVVYKNTLKAHNLNRSQ